MFISRRLGEYTYLVHSRDCQEVRIKSEASGELRIVNIYNNQQQGAALTLMQELLPPVHEQRKKKVSCLVLGDFNLHHPTWVRDNAPRDARAEDLLDLMESAGLDNWIRPGTVTRDQTGFRSTIDLVLASYSLREQMIACEVDLDTHANSDHPPIRTTLEINLPEVSDPVKSLRSQLGTSSNALKEVQTIKTGFALCPASPVALSTLEARKKSYLLTSVTA